MSDAGFNLQQQPVKALSERQPTQEVLDRFSETSISLHHGRRGHNCVDSRGQDSLLAAGSDRLVGKSSRHRDMIELVTSLYDGKSSSWLPVDIRRDRGEVENATGYDRAAGYGEIVLDDFIDMLDDAGAHAGQCFYDLGSGLGQLVFAAGLLGLDATGIEIVKQRHDQACAAVQLAEVQGVGHSHGSVKFVHGSFYDMDFSDADIVFVNSVLFSDEMMYVISEKARNMKHGSRIYSYLGLLDMGRNTKHLGTWFRQMKSISLKTTFSAGSPWKSYMGVRSSEATMLTPPDETVVDESKIE